MLIIYRTNKGFGGQIAALARQQSAAEFAAWSAANADVALAALEVDAESMDPALLADLALGPEGYRVVAGELKRADGTSADLGYSVDVKASLAQMRENSTLKALFEMTDAQALAWIRANGEEAALIQVLRILRSFARAIRAVK